MAESRTGPGTEARRSAVGEPEPALAIGHLILPANDVPRTVAFLEQLGVKPIVTRESFAVIELRGGTHIVVQRADGPIEPETELPFDFMVDDLTAAHARCAELGAAPSAIHHGDIHSSFTITDPSGIKIEVVSSHAVWHPA
jgi:hypothetical protein